MTGIWEEAWRLAKYDIKRFKWNYLIMIVFAIFVGLNATMVIHSMQDPMFVLNRYLIDIYFITIIPVFGCPWYSQKYSASTFNQLRLYRMLPISVRGVVLSRMLLVVLRMVPNAMLFFVPLYLIAGELRSQLDPIQYLLFVAIWLGYCLAMSGWYPYWELISQNMLNLWLYSIYFLLLIAAVACLFWFVFDLQLMPSIVTLAQSNGWLGALLSLGLGFICFSLWGKLATRKIQQGIF